MSRRVICASALSGLRSEDDDGTDGELVEYSDGGKGAEDVYDAVDRSCFATNSRSESHFKLMARRARDFVRRNAPSLLPTLNAILRNGSNRQESIFELAKLLKARERTWSAAEKRYYRGRARLLRLFEA